MTHAEEILERNPAPWTCVKISDPKRGTCKIVIRDYNGNDVCTIHQETATEGMQLGNALCQFPEMLFKITNATR